MTIKLDTTSLREEFPTFSDADVEKLVSRYLNVVSEVLWESNLHDFPKQYEDTVFFSTSTANKLCSSVYPNGVRTSVWNIMTKHCPLFWIKDRGNNLKNKTGAYSEVVFTEDVEMLLALTGKPEDLVDLVLTDGAGKLVDLTNAHWVPIDETSLRNYIKSNEARENRNNTLDYNLQQARIIYGIAEAFKWKFPQVPNESVFGRLYYKLINLQNCPKVVRNAALGDCWQYDIKTAVYAVMLDLVEGITVSEGKDTFGKFTYTKEYIESKEAIRKRLARDTFGGDEDWQVAIIKEAFTAIGFGARPTASTWFEDGERRVSALREIIKSPDKAAAFLADSFVSEFVEEQKKIGDIVNAYLTSDREFAAFLKTIDGMCDKRGTLKRAKVLAYIYQQTERTLLDAMTEYVVRERGADELLLTVHDGFYTRSKQKALELREILKSHNKHLDLDVTQHKAYTWVDLDHKQDIEDEERRAKEYAAQRGNASFASRSTPVAEQPSEPVDPDFGRRLVEHYMQETRERDMHGRQSENHEGYYDGSGYDGSTYNREDDPYYMKDENEGDEE